ncbi:hypothetical protein SUGI_0802560 [Cryptomeria japonica]|nr:hypothetical protein SUGI_0802560 [Cryptomeria japonica]
MDVYSLVMAWGLESGEDMEMVRSAMEALVPNDYLGELDSLLEWTIPNVGFYVGEGVNHEGDGIKKAIIPFLRWAPGQCKSHHRLEARRGWEALKLLIQIKELEAVIEQAKAEEAEARRRTLRLRRAKTGSGPGGKASSSRRG